MSGPSDTRARRGKHRLVDPVRADLRDLGSYQRIRRSEDGVAAREMLAQFALEVSDDAEWAARNVPHELLRALVDTATLAGLGATTREAVEVRAGMRVMRPDLFRNPTQRVRRPASNVRVQASSVSLPLVATSVVRSRTVSCLETLQRCASLSDLQASQDICWSLSWLDSLAYTVDEDPRHVMVECLGTEPLASSRWHEPISDWFGGFWEKQSILRKRLPSWLVGWPTLRAAVTTEGSGPDAGATITVLSKASSAQWAIWHEAPLASAADQITLDWGQGPVRGRVRLYRLVELTPY